MLSLPNFPRFKDSESLQHPSLQKLTAWEMAGHPDSPLYQMDSVGFLTLPDCGCPEEQDYCPSYEHADTVGSWARVYSYTPASRRAHS